MKVELHHGDCLEIMRGMPDASVDVVLTDPPYCSGGYLEAQKNTKAQGLRGATVAADDFKWFAADNMSTSGLVWLLRSMLIECRRILRPDRSAFIFTDWRMVPNVAPVLEASGMRYRNMIVWDKGNGGLGVGFRPTHEIIMEFTNGSTEYADNTGTNVLSFSRVHSSKKEHNAEKPTELLERILRIASFDGATVFDPFMGSGSTGVAAVQSGRRFVGVELDRNYYEIAEQRIREAQQQMPLKLPASSADEYRQSGMFGD